MNTFSKEKIPDFLNLLPVGTVLLNQAGDCIYANTAFENLAGLKGRQALGKGWLTHIAVENIDEKLEALLAGKVTQITFEQDSGPAFVRLTSVSAGDGLYCCTAEKLGESPDAGDRQKLMQKMLDCTDAILYSVDRQGNIMAFNYAASQAIRLRKGITLRIGDYWPDIVSGESGLEKERMEMLLQYVLSGNSHKTIESLFIDDGKTITYSVQASPIFDETRQIIGAVLCAHDITVETRLQKEAAEKALIRTQDLERWNQFYDKLLSVLAHDLRQPLATIIMSADLVTYTQKNLSADEIKTIMGSLRNTSKKSIELLQGLLYWVKSKKEDFSYKPVPLDLCDLINEANVLFIQDQEKKHISLHNEVPEGMILYAHHQMILFVCRNLISNATKFAYPDSTIRICATAADGELTIAVHDSGKGMTAEQLAGLFRVKEQGVIAEGIDGAGMALTIVHDMIGQMDGRIRAESEPGKGTTFYMTFPA